MDNRKNIYILFIYFIPVLLIGFCFGFFLNFNNQSVKIDSLFNKGINIRGGIPNVKKKILNKEEIKVVYFGGSITQMDGWRNKTTEWLRNTYTNSTFKEFNSCISGSGSFFGIYRLEEDVIRYNPDLVFVEFAVNDSISDDYINRRLSKNLTEIVSRIKKAKPDSDIVFVYTISRKMLSFYDRGNVFSSAEKMDEVADKFCIPSINFGFRTAFLWQNKLLRFDPNDNYSKSIPLFSPDGVHPEQYGHEIYLSLMRDFFEMTMNETFKNQTSIQKNTNYDPSSQKTHKLVEVDKSLFKPELTSTKPIKMNYGKDSVFSKTNLLAYAWNGQELNAKIKGSIFGIVISMPPGSYNSQVVIDNSKILNPKFYYFGSTNPRLYYSEYEIPNDGNFHDLKITKNNNPEFNLIYFLTDGEIDNK